MPTVRFNYRAWPERGQYDEGRGETADALAVVAWGRERWPGVPWRWPGFPRFDGGAAGDAGGAASGTHHRGASGFECTVFGLERPACPWLIIQGMSDEVVDYAQVEAFAARFVPPPALRLLPALITLQRAPARTARSGITALGGDIVAPRIARRYEKQQAGR